jgi:hypothetical protein
MRSQEYEDENAIQLTMISEIRERRREGITIKKSLYSQDIRGV